MCILNKFFFLGIIFLSCKIFLPCQGYGQVSDPPSENNMYLEEDDPLEGLNRGLYAFNSLIDTLFMRPIALTYRYVTPPFLRTGISNATSNLAEPLSFINHTIQLEGDAALTSLARFLVNSTLGILGLFDPATEMGLPQREGDLGQTFAKLDVGPGPYLVLPILGPSNLRDALGIIGDFFMDPMRYIVPKHRRKNLTYVHTGEETLVRRESLLDITDDIEKAHDPYLRAKLFFEQNRDFQINYGEPQENLGPTPY